MHQKDAKVKLLLQDTDGYIIIALSYGKGSFQRVRMREYVIPLSTLSMIYFPYHEEICFSD